jgi:aminoglycoside 3-N-acetyltransferase
VSPASLPHTRESLRGQLRDLGVRPGSVLLTHSSFAALGWVCGGPVALAQALLDVLGPDGTLVVPTHTPENSDPEGWRHPPVPESWWPVIRDEMPGFDPAITPSRWMGLLAETVRTWPGALRSDHPHTSFAAVGRDAAAVVADHQLDEMLGDASPVGRVYRLDGDVLLLGVGHESNSSLHLAEYRVAVPKRTRHGAAVRTRAGDGGWTRTWTWWEDVDVDERDFVDVGADFDGSGATMLGRVGGAVCRLLRQRELVDFAVDWFTRHRPS